MSKRYKCDAEDCNNKVEEEGEWCDDCAEAALGEFGSQDFTSPGIYDREPDEPGMDYGPDMDDI